MAILNRGEELPRDRVRLYEKAAEVLLFQWDFEEKEGLVDPRLTKYLVELDFRDKRAMLQQVAYRMQSSAEGLAGNFVTREVLQDCLVDYLRHKKDAAQAPSIAGLVIEQLRERNFILCALGGDNYAFIHRTFLEYFCAIEIVERFGKRGTEGGLTFEQLRDEVFGAHWQDPTWHEVLRLICGEIAPEFAGELIEFLMGLEVDRSKFLESGRFLKKEGLLNLFLATDCLEEVRDRSAILSISQQLLKQLQQEAETENLRPLGYDAANDLLQRIATIWGESASVNKWLLECLEFEHSDFVPGSAVKVIAQKYKDNPETLTWLKYRVQQDDNGNVRSAAVREIAKGWKEDPETLTMLKNCIQHDDLGQVRSAAVKAIARGWKEDPETLPLLKNRVQQDDNGFVRSAAVEAIAQGWKDDPETLPMLKDRVQKDSNEFVRSSVVRALDKGWKDHPETLPMIKDLSQQDVNLNVRNAAVEAIAEGWKNDPNAIQLLLQVASQDSFKREQPWQDNPRQIALQALFSQAPTDPQIIELLRDRATNDNDEQLRKWAEERLKGIGD
jgi:predicted NACHT family NTPase